MGESKDERCENCRYWFDAQYDDSGGVCRRYPPIGINTYPETYGKECSYVITIWPDAMKHQWCGEYSPREDTNGRV